MMRQCAFFAGSTKSVPPTALLVRSGDAILLTGASRQCYHGVPRILGERGPAKAFMPNDDSEYREKSQLFNYMQDRRINVSIRETC